VVVVDEQAGAVLVAELAGGRFVKQLAAVFVDELSEAAVVIELAGWPSSGRGLSSSRSSPGPSSLMISPGAVIAVIIAGMRSMRHQTCVRCHDGTYVARNSAHIPQWGEGRG